MEVELRKWCAPFVCMPWRAAESTDNTFTKQTAQLWWSGLYNKAHDVWHSAFVAPSCLCLAVCGRCVLALIGGCVCLCGCCAVNAELCPAHMKADQRLSWSVLFIVHVGMCTCTEAALVGKCQLSSPHHELKTWPHLLVSLWGVVMCARVKGRAGVSPFDLTSLDLIDCDGAMEDT